MITARPTVSWSRRIISLTPHAIRTATGDNTIAQAAAEKIPEMILN
jgi:hypothetical protein